MAQHITLRGIAVRVLNEGASFKLSGAVAVKSDTVQLNIYGKQHNESHSFEWLI